MEPDRLPCADLPTAWFYPYVDDDDPQAPQERPGRSRALAACRTCPARAACLLRALNAGEEWGIWGGLDFHVASDHVATARRSTPNSPQWRSALSRALAATRGADEAASQGKNWPWQPARGCTRCRAPIPAGWHPPDRNSPGATCGKVSTYNRGCRCVACSVVKSQKESERRRSRR